MVKCPNGEHFPPLSSSPPNRRPPRPPHVGHAILAERPRAAPQFPTPRRGNGARLRLPATSRKQHENAPQNCPPCPKSEQTPRARASHSYVDHFALPQRTPRGEHMPPRRRAKAPTGGAAGMIARRGGHFWLDEAIARDAARSLEVVHGCWHSVGLHYEDISRGNGGEAGLPGAARRGGSVWGGGNPPPPRGAKKPFGLPSSPHPPFSLPAEARPLRLLGEVCTPLGPPLPPRGPRAAL